MKTRITLLVCTLLFGYSGFAQTPQLVADINPGISNSDPCWLTAFQNKLYFLRLTAPMAGNSGATMVLTYPCLSKEAGKGDHWAEGWVADRENRYAPKFREMFEKQSDITL